MRKPEHLAPGRERRRRFVYATRNSAYYVFDRRCVAVRDLANDLWLAGHRAVNRKVAGSVCVYDNGTTIPKDNMPSLGDGMFFALSQRLDRHLITSPVVDIRRPDRHELQKFPHL